jgi:hypothetical protein
MESNTAKDIPIVFQPPYLDVYGRLMVSVAELAAIHTLYTVNHLALVAIELDQDLHHAA